MRKLPQTQRDVLAALATYGTWARPMDVGATDGSHHSMTLRALVKKGLVERKLRPSIINELRGEKFYARLARDQQHRHRDVPRGSYEYRITTEGQKLA